MTVLCGSDLGDGLAVWNLRCEELDIELVLVVEKPLDDVDMLLAVSAEDGLAEFLGVFYDDGRVGGRNLLESVTELLLVLLYLCLDGAAVLRGRIRNLVILDA